MVSPAYSLYASQPLNHAPLAAVERIPHRDSHSPHSLSLSHTLARPFTTVLQEAEAVDVVNTVVNTGGVVNTRCSPRGEHRAA